MLTEFYTHITEQLAELSASGNLRRLPECGSRNGKYLTIDGRDYLNLSSNDYLGLTQNRELLQDFYQHLQNGAELENQFSPGSTASRLLVGNHSLYTELEKRLTGLYRQQGSISEALVFNSGYHANLGILPAITTKKDLILSDKLNHASIIDGFRLAEADFLRYKHLDYDHLDHILATKRCQYRFVVIVSETLFSMDGDLANLHKLVEIKKKHNALLYLDEAHSFGVFGTQGLGWAVQSNLLKDIDILVATFGKALGGLGAFALVNPLLKKMLINRMRPLIFSTALPPVVLNWLNFALDKMVLMERERDQLLAMSSLLRETIRSFGCQTLGESQIVPLILGKNQLALDMAARLRESGIIALPIRPPTVPPGSARIRFSLTATINCEDIEHVSNAIK